MQCVLVLKWPCFQALTMGWLPATTGESFGDGRAGRDMTTNHMAWWKQIEAENKRHQIWIVQRGTPSSDRLQMRKHKKMHSEHPLSLSPLPSLLSTCQTIQSLICRTGAKPPIQIDQRQITHVQLIKWGRRVHLSFKSHYYEIPSSAEQQSAPLTRLCAVKGGVKPDMKSALTVAAVSAFVDDIFLFPPVVHVWITVWMKAGVCRSCLHRKISWTKAGRGNWIIKTRTLSICSSIITC